jgi:uncharacterized protein YprB with RNaseH-like and TPR domain
VAAPPADVLGASHILLPGVGPLTERRLWQEGVHTLRDFAASGHLRGFSAERKRALDREAERAVAAHLDGDVGFLAGRLPHGEAWRLFPRFREEAAYLDIETTGLSRFSAITVVGVHRPRRPFKALVRGAGLTASAISEALEGAKLLVTFNGASFDLPFVRASFPAARLPPAHLDLLTCTRRLGWRGGLKSIERSLGLARDLEMRVLAGHDAVRLWRAYERSGSTNALRLLVAYNRADCENLEPVAEASTLAMARRLEIPAARGPRQAALPT